LTDRDRRYYALAVHVAGWSKDPSTKVGAVLVGVDQRMVALGYNGFPPGVEDLPERLADRECKYALTQHAERNVLDNAWFDCRGATLYCTQIPCSGCGKSVVSKGVRRVVCPPPPTREPWASDCRWAILMFEEVGIELEYVVQEGSA
jgi:dCMP deaminase